MAFLKFLLKVLAWLLFAYLMLFIGAWFEKLYPDAPVTEIWGVSMIGVFAVIWTVFVFSQDRKKAIKVLSKTGLYDEAKLLIMKRKELLLRARLHKKDDSMDWSARSFAELLDVEKAEREHSRALLGALAGASAEQTCRNCGHKVSTWSASKLHPGVFASTPCEKNGRFCIPL